MPFIYDFYREVCNSKLPVNIENLLETKKVYENQKKGGKMPERKIQFDYLANHPEERLEHQSICLTFKDIRTINDAVYQNPGGFSGVNSSLFYSTPTSKEKELADRVINGEDFHPATHSLWFYAPGSGNNCSPTWWDQQLSGKYKNHCFYKPYEGICPELY